MHDNRSHPLLEQVPLAVSPFVHLPRATTLPYRYKTMPSALPPSVLDAPPAAGASGDSATKPAYVTSASASASATSAHPDDILRECRRLREHLDRLQASAESDLQRLQASIRERDLAEKRRVAPGWLDSDERLLVPERSATSPESQSQHLRHPSDHPGGPSEMAAEVAGPDLDRAFGGLNL